MASSNGEAGLTDSDILIDASRGLVEAVAFLTSQQSMGGRISIVSAMELVAGCRDAKQLSQVQQFLQRVVILPVSANISQSAYQLMETFFLSHGLLIPDSLIAATAISHGLSLYTKNVRHFGMIPGLTIIRPY